MNKKQIENVFNYTIEEFLKRLKQKDEIGKTIADIVEKGILEGLSYQEIDHLVYNYIENLKSNLVENNNLEIIESIVFCLLKAKEDTIEEE